MDCNTIARTTVTLIFGARPLGKDADAAVQAVRDRHAAIAKALAEAPARYALLFMRTDEGVVLAQDWAAGFLAAVRLRLEAWRPLLDGPAWLGLLPILIHTLDPAIEARIARLPAEARHHLAEAYRHIPSAVAALREHSLPARLAAAATSSQIH
ncbi:MAG TPA: UPF0149 family protein [Geminicoccaceae bacterium]|nr:UPF0149 family protein [Geminicoccaceae bacterium]